ncbi:hypothetical protein HYN56_11245 [Flavobacterium crocinum]|uniref:Uncharacterized protein n=1 Tax=Flavobacterium crocinum TaxID=2183896 RepID=A0A2S1YL06_9FLAO|nr:hypothetical protein [Flavobacterium crocinum]AWK04767.1 hypothetical protein HYN56_11245 [Flavobacterium crocinum]
MSDQYLKPFKGKFILHVKTTMKNFFSNPNQVSLIDKYTNVADELGNVDIAKFIKQYALGFSKYKEYKHLQFNYHKASDLSPENLLNNDERDCQLTFKLESFDIEVLQIIDSKITFASSANEVYTIELNDNLKLIKLNNV